MEAAYLILLYGRTLTGAWIETATYAVGVLLDYVAPSRVRGLKHC